MKSSGYTMADFRAEMRRRGVSSHGVDKRALERGRMPRPEMPKPKKPRVLTCAIHPLHTVKVNADGSRSGCAFCDDYIRDLCRLFQSPSTSQDPTD